MPETRRGITMRSRHTVVQSPPSVDNWPGTFGSLSTSSGEQPSVDEHVQVPCTVSVSAAVGPVPVNRFSFNGESVRLNPPLEFSVVLNHRDGTWELHGNNLYASVFVSASDIAGAIDELRTDVLPFLWRQYALEDDARLSPDAKQLKADLRRRVRA